MLRRNARYWLCDVPPGTGSRLIKACEMLFPPVSASAGEPAETSATTAMASARMNARATDRALTKYSVKSDSSPCAVSWPIASTGKYGAGAVRDRTFMCDVDHSPQVARETALA